MYKSHTVGGVCVWGGVPNQDMKIIPYKCSRGKKKQASDVMQRVCKGAVAAFLPTSWWL